MGPAEWPMAMMAFSLLVSNDPSRLDEVLEIYPLFREKTSAAERVKSLALLEAFIRQRKGEGWRAMLGYALGDEPAVSLRAAKLVTLMAKPEEGERFTGVRELVRLLMQRSDAPKTLLSAVLDLADLRVEPLLEPLFGMDGERLAKLLPAAMANRLSCNWTLSLLEKRPELAELVTASLCAMAARPKCSTWPCPSPLGLSAPRSASPCTAGRHPSISPACCRA